MGCTGRALQAAREGVLGAARATSLHSARLPLGPESKNRVRLSVLPLLPHLLATILLFKVASEPASEQKQRHMKAELWRDS